MYGKTLWVCSVDTNNLERERCMALEQWGGNYDNIMTTGWSAKADFTWRRNNIMTWCCHIKQQKFYLEIFSDASLSSWGTV